MSDQTHYGVLLANTGTPAEPTAKEIKKYLKRFLSDPRIVPMNRVLWWFVLNVFILPKRSEKNVEKYESIWTDEGSPFTVGHEKLTAGLQAAFLQDGFDNIEVVCGMSYSEPDIENSLMTLCEAGCEEIIVLPLYPQSAYSITGAVRDAVDRAVSKHKIKAPVHLIDNYHDNATYTKAIAASLKHAGFDVDSDDKIIFSFHSIPINDIEAGDTYELQVDASSLQIASHLGIERRRWTIGYQCRFDKGREWLMPFTSGILKRWAENGNERIFFILPGFSVECLETIYDIEHELEPSFRQACEDAGRAYSPHDFVYVPCLDRSKAHVQVLKDVLSPYVKK